MTTRGIVRFHIDGQVYERVKDPAPKIKPSRGGSRKGAGRPRTETLDAAELRFLADLLQYLDSDYDESALIEKLRRIAERVERTGR